MHITPKIVGERLKSYREYLELTQSDLSEKLEVNQNIISRIENGKNSNVKQLFLLINYYNIIFDLSNIFSSAFEVLEKNSITDEDNIKNITIEKIKLLQENLNDEIDSIKNLL